MATFKNIIFDLGGVLIDWNPEYVYLQVFNGDRAKMRWFLEHICTFEWNEAQDAGRPLQEATALLLQKFPEYSEEIKAYYGRWEEMLGGAIQPTVEVLKSLIGQEKYRIVALTNWSAETFPVALRHFEFLHWFEDIVVSGKEGMRKPFPEIYRLTLDRFGFLPQETVFIDDNLRNVEAAKALGIDAIPFQDAAQLRQSLSERNIYA